MVAQPGSDVYAHHVETAEALTPFVLDRDARFRESLQVLKEAKEAGVAGTKSIMMLGASEADAPR